MDKQPWQYCALRKGARLRYIIYEGPVALAYIGTGAVYVPAARAQSFWHRRQAVGIMCTARLLGVTAGP